MRYPTVPLIILLASLLVGCAVNQGKPVRTPSAETPSTSVQPTSLKPTEVLSITQMEASFTPSLKLAATPTPVPGGAGYDAIVQAAIDDLARRLGVGSQTIALVSISGDEFPAGDLGCPSPKETPRPIPAFVTGQVIVLEVQGEQYIYHARKGQVAFCGKW